MCFLRVRTLAALKPDRANVVATPRAKSSGATTIGDPTWSWRANTQISTNVHKLKVKPWHQCSEILYRSGPTQETSGNHPVDQVEPPRHGTHLRVRGQFPISQPGLILWCVRSKPAHSHTAASCTKSKPCRLLHTMQHRAIPVLFNSADTRSLDNYCTSWLNMLRTYLDFSFDHLWSASIPPVCWDFWVFRCLQCPEKVLVRFCSKPICSSARWRRSKATQSSGRPEAMASGSPAVPWGACSWTAKYCTANEPEMMCWWHHVTSLQFLSGALVRSKEDANMFGIVWTCLDYILWFCLYISVISGILRV